ncbi:MAG TPA: hypothetical protein CFH81_06415 [Sulfurovum sp. UBA12169]|nr:MAG TPA: hypothetical protein CFH81_06415 [Sulfurovum sp. UBA12169]
MKRYLSVLIMLAVTVANAQNNPFDLKENLQKIDHAQSVFLDELKLLAQKKEALEESKQEDDIFVEPGTEENRSAIGTAQNTQAPAERISPSEKETQDAEKLRTEAKRVLRLKEEQAAREQEISNLKKEEDELLGLKKEQGEAEKEKTVAAQLQDINLSKAQLGVKQNTDKDYQEAVQEMDGKVQEGVKKEKSAAVQIQDINVSKEQLEAKQNADKDYQDAIQEMDEER